MKVRETLFAMSVALAACGQEPASLQPDPPAAPEEPALVDQAAPLIDLLTPTVSEAVGRPVSLQVRRVAVSDEWAWLVVEPRQPDGAPLDWSATNFASAHEQGVMDESGATYALFQRDDGEWRLVDHAIAPTDVAWEDWPTRYGAPAVLFEAPL